MSKIEAPKSFSELPTAVATNIVTLTTSSFGLVVALAWNEFIKELVNEFISPYFGANSGVITLLIYALTVTILAIIATMQLANLQNKVSKPKKKRKKTKK